MNSPNYKPVYRPDVDGLRALAIISVIIFHTFPTFAPGGFVGVDIFFVISGYLISLILFKSIGKGSFSFLDFYSHRILRIFPALIVTLLACIIVGWYFLLPDEYAQLGKHIVASASFVENFNLWRESGYFDVAAEKKPLMHLWSLAVEEQFYLFFPFLVWLAYRLSMPLVWLIGSLCLLSFVANVLGVYFFDPKLAFLSSMTRFWELMVGALLALKYNELSQIKKNHSYIMSLIGIAMILTSLYGFHAKASYPGLLAALPVLGTACIIASGNQAWFNRKVLSNRLSVFIGKISYPLYIYHWPLLSIPLIITAEKLSAQMTILLMVACFILASITYLYIEKPVRYGGGSLKIKVVLLLSLTCFLGYAGYNFYARHGLEFRAKKIIANNNQLNFRKLPPTYAYLNNCVTRFPHFWGGCMQAKNADPSIALLGDSHSLNLFYGLSELSKDNAEINILNLRRDSAYFMKNVGTSSDKSYLGKKQLDETSTITNQAYEIITNTSSIHSVILVLRGPAYLDENQKILRLMHHPEMTDNKLVWQAALKETVTYLLAQKKHVMIVLDWPALTFDPKRCIHYLSKDKATDQLCAIDRQSYEKANADFRELAKNVLKEFPTIAVVDTTSYFCDNTFCYAKKGDDILYKDQEGHLSLQGALFLGKFLMPTLGKFHKPDL